MEQREARLHEFVAWWRQYCKGDEKGEAQIFLDRLFTALGYEGGLMGAQGQPESRVKFTLEEKPSTKFADLVIPGRVLVEMKKRGENLAAHIQQAVSYWVYQIPHPRYIVLCNFDEFWVYDMEYQVADPIDKVQVENLAGRWGPLAFLFPQPEKPVFDKSFDLIDLTAQAAFSLSEIFRLLIRPARDIPRDHAQRFILQCMLALFAEDIGLLPRYTFTRVIDDCMDEGANQNSYDLFTLLFWMMNEPGVKKAGRFYGVDYFNGGIFQQIHPVLLSREELRLVREAANQNWSQIRPAIFGRIFEGSIEKGERHQTGAHYTSERDILRIVEPVIVRPWLMAIESATTADALRGLHTALCAYTVLDPACGSGNFLYVAYREMKKLEQTIFDRLTQMGEALPDKRVLARQFFGYDINPFAVELAKVTLMIAKKLAVDELHGDERPLPLDNLDSNIKAEDALFADWGRFDAVIGNPPYLGAKRLKQEYSAAYINRVRAAFPDVPGNADYCVYWFRKAHDLLPDGGRAGLVGTNSIRQNYSREGGLDYIVENGGRIFEAVSSMEWSGEANVHVSIACWEKLSPPPQSPSPLRGEEEVKKSVSAVMQTPRLWLNGDTSVEVPLINSSLSPKTDVSKAKVLTCNTTPQRVFQGQTPGHERFVLTDAEATAMIRKKSENAQVIKAYLIGRDLLSNAQSQPERFIINMNGYDILEARQFSAAYKHLETYVLPDREQNAKLEAEKNQRALEVNPNARVNHHHEMFLRYWWRHSYDRSEMVEVIRGLQRFIVCSRVTKRPIFEFISPKITAGDSLQVFAFDDDYTFGILQSNAHWQWFIEKSSTLRNDYRYTPHSVYDTFPFPQNPSPEKVKAVAAAARALHEFRRTRMSKGTTTLRELYRSLELPGKNELKDLHAALDKAVLAAYGFDANGDVLAGLLALNLEVAAKIERGEPVNAPGIPADYPTPAELISTGCIQPPELL